MDNEKKKRGRPLGSGKKKTERERNSTLDKLQKKDRDRRLLLTVKRKLTVEETDGSKKEIYCGQVESPQLLIEEAERLIAKLGLEISSKWITVRVGIKFARLLLTHEQFRQVRGLFEESNRSRGLTDGAQTASRWGSNKPSRESGHRF